MVTEIGYDTKTLQPTSLKTTLPGGIIEQDLTYSYYDSGDISKITDNLDGAKTQDFVYDELYRLTSAKGVYGNL